LKPRVFIASASESRDLAFAVQANLEEVASVTVWDQEVFQAGEYTLQSLEREAELAEFGVFILTGEDLATIRGIAHKTPRANVLMELGIFIGRLGRERSFMLASEGTYLPSDLAGVNLYHYDAARKDNLRAATSTACAELRKTIGERRFKLKSHRAIEQILQVVARLIALRSGLEGNEIRGFCHLFDDQHETLIPVARYTGIRMWDDRNVPVPCSATNGLSNWYIIRNAFCENRYKCAEVDWERPGIIGLPHAKDIRQDLCSVVAHPISLQNVTAAPIGTLSFDSSKRLATIGWQNDRDLKDILAVLSESLYSMITRMH
jgi:Predicted nucleotide-binding protein containing TIR-like domain